MINMKEVFAKNLESWRTRCGMSQRELSRVSGVSQTTIHNIEVGKNKSPTARSIKMLLKALNLDSVEEMVSPQSKPLSEFLDLKEQYLIEKEKNISLREELSKYRSFFDVETLSKEDALIMAQLIKIASKKSKEEVQHIMVHAMSENTLEFINTICKIMENDSS